ncbi:hypothetical protein [Azospirillum canadense]|uniref:hypothetical protein n=1 Tax=Azospirillum canadense TaxID=403962 RepID=UPI0022264C2E|nr:hypothetical protein [Azospirillum canadense]MCW2240738.1 hypothetical protein [Azospirillum canadense]
MILTNWVWLRTGIDRRVLGWNAERAAWDVSGPLAAVASSQPGTPPSWATTVGHRAVHLSEPAVALTDDMLDAIDRFRSGHPCGTAQAAGAISVRVWRPQPPRSVAAARCLA